jgi:hypothetical protein
MFVRTMLPLLAALSAASAAARPRQFIDTFDHGPIASDPAARKGWASFTGDGEATMTFAQEAGAGVIRVDATHDRRGIWWALIKHSISADIDGKALARPDRELRIEARVRSRTAPRRVNLSVNHTRTTDYDSNLAEFDLPDTDWHVIGFTTHGFDAQPRDEVFAQLALMDWGLDRYEVDVDYFKVTLVDRRAAPPDQGEPMLYRPPIPSLSSFRTSVPVAQDAIVDAAYPWVNFRAWRDMSSTDPSPTLSISGTQMIVLRFDLSAFKGRTPDGWGLLELTTENIGWAPTDLEEFGYLRVAEILGGDPTWRRDSVTLESLLADRPRSEVLGQMMMDVPPNFQRGGKTLIRVTPPVLARLLSGRTKGLAIYAQGAVNGSFYSQAATDPAKRPVLHVNFK